MEVPAEPVPRRATSNRSDHRLVNRGLSVLELRPGRRGVVLVVVCLALALVTGVAGLRGLLHAAVAGTLTIVLVLGGALFGVVGVTFAVRGARARFDRDAGTVVLTGWRFEGRRELPLGAVRAVQLCDAGWVESNIQPSSRYHAFQVNLVVEAPTFHRITLLESGGEERLTEIARRIAEFSNVPLYIGAQVADP